MSNSGNPMVSVIVPVYNIADLLPGCLQSLLNQTLQNIEILCVDDGSKDESVRVIESFRQKDSRVHLLLQDHKGVSAARNLGLSHAGGSYVAFFDGDDWVEPDMLKIMADCAVKSGSDMVICSAQVHFEQESEKSGYLIRSLTAEAGTWEKDSGETPWQCITRPGSWPFIWNKLISRELIERNSLEFPQGLPLGEDGVLVHLLFQCANKISWLPNRFYNYRYQRKGSATVRLSDHEMTRFQQHIRVLDAMGRGFDRLGLLPAQGLDLLKWGLDFLYSDFVHLPVTAQEPMGKALGEVLERHGLKDQENLLGPIRRNRMKHLLGGRKPGKTGRMARILLTKAENRMMKYFRMG